MFKRLQLWLAAHPRWTLSLLVVVALGPSLAKPFNIDDPLFIWLARQVRSHPANFFDFQVNWYGFLSPMWAVTENPPGAGYYYALAGTLFGWNEIGLHLGTLLAAIAVILGTYRLAARLTGHPLVAACAVLFTPVFLVSASTVMCDMLLLAWWVWAVVFWVEGLENEQPAKVVAAALLVTVAILTKYFGVALIPLLIAHGAAQKRKLGGWLAALLIPLASLGAFQWLTKLWYGHALFTAAAGFSNASHSSFGFSKPAACAIALSFVGGSVATTIFVAPWLWRRRMLAVIFCVTALAGGFICVADVLPKYPALEDASRWLATAQFALWMIGGVLVVWLAAEVWNRPRDPHAWLLALWVAGTFLFTAFGNWTINGRTVLPMVPAVAILLARRWERAGSQRPLALKCSLAACAALALFVNFCDYQLAVAVRRGAEAAMAWCRQTKGTVWYEGHWGFQYYMEKLGAQAVTFDNFSPPTGDLLVVPVHNCCTSEPGTNAIIRRDVVSVPGPVGLTTWHAAVGAGFYSSYFGLLPFAFGRVPAEDVHLFELRKVPPE
ncbi:MAG: glycosyltransferase family 39 protein [Verrucomicrobiota bacterium]|jgi:4-amino-4-deoxy-L-arabinose transferase-like glycosyltransferase